jgi:hypothetical protein
LWCSISGVGCVTITSSGGSRNGGTSGGVKTGGADIGGLAPSWANIQSGLCFCLKGFLLIDIAVKFRFQL